MTDKGPRAPFYPCFQTLQRIRQKTEIWNKISFQVVLQNIHVFTHFFFSDFVPGSIFPEKKLRPFVFYAFISASFFPSASDRAGSTSLTGRPARAARTWSTRWTRPSTDTRRESCSRIRRACTSPTSGAKGAGSRSNLNTPMNWWTSVTWSSSEATTEEENGVGLEKRAL